MCWRWYLLSKESQQITTFVRFDIVKELPWFIFTNNKSKFCTPFTVLTEITKVLNVFLINYTLFIASSWNMVSSYKIFLHLLVFISV